MRLWRKRHRETASVCDVRDSAHEFTNNSVPRPELNMAAFSPKLTVEPPGCVWQKVIRNLATLPGRPTRSSITSLAATSTLALGLLHMPRARVQGSAASPSGR